MLLRADNHPDSHVVRLDEDAQQIKVDQIRELIESLSLSSYRGGYKVGVIEGAEALNANGANAFLKTLEEPTGDTLLILIAKPSHRLPATIASRCLRLNLRRPAEAEALALAQGARPGRLRSGMRRSTSPAARRCWRWNSPPRTSQRSSRRCARRSKQLAADSVDVTLLAERWVKSDPAAAGSLGLRTGSHGAYMRTWATRHFASKCGTRPLACRFT